MVSGLPARSRRIVALALWSGALLLLLVALVVYAGAFALDPSTRLQVASMLGLVALVDLMLGSWFFRSSRSS